MTYARSTVGTGQDAAKFKHLLRVTLELCAGLSHPCREIGQSFLGKICNACANVGIRIPFQRQLLRCNPLRPTCSLMSQYIRTNLQSCSDI